MSGGGPDYDRGENVLCDPQGNIFLIFFAGGRSGSFDGLPFVPMAGGRDFFVAKLHPAPPLRIDSSESGKTAVYPARATNYVLQSTTSLAPGSAWAPVLTLPTTVGTEATVPVDVTGPAQFFRLRKP